MRKEERLTRSRDFARIRRSAWTTSDGLLIMKVRPNGLQVSRFGFAAGRKLGKAVVRNKIKRRLREVVSLTKIETGLDMLLIVRKGAVDSDYEQLKCSFVSLLARTKALMKTNQNPLRRW